MKDKRYYTAYTEWFFFGFTRGCVKHYSAKWRMSRRQVLKLLAKWCQWHSKHPLTHYYTGEEI